MTLENILPQEMILRLGWTLLHFVWQATAVALLLGILLAGLRKATANIRYLIACAALGLIVLLPIVTTLWVPVSIPQAAASIEPRPVPFIVPVQPSNVETPEARVVEFEEPVRAESIAMAPTIPWKQRATEKLEASLPYLVMGWLLGVFGLSLWHLGGWAQLQRLKRHMIKPVADSLQTKLNELSERLRIHRAVQLVESALVQVPTVVGWLRPAILLPASALTGLTTEQLEALLAHELAHIRRYDYLVNILQTIVETLGFFHPAVWWISHKIRVERENCCDDLAVTLSGDRIRYARALASMEEIRAGRSELAVAATGGNLSGRIRRLVGKNASDGSRAGWIPSVITILLIAIIAVPTSIAFNNNGRTKDQKRSIAPNKVVLKLVDPNSQPVVGARVGTSVEWSDTLKNPPKCFLRDGGLTRVTREKSDKHGKIALEEGDVFWSVPPTEQKAPFTAINKDHSLAVLQELSRENLGTEVTLTLQPACQVHGRLTAAAARKRHLFANNLNVWVYWRVHTPYRYAFKQGRFDFVLPPGRYRLRFFSGNPNNSVSFTLPILIKPGQRELDLTGYLDGTSQLPETEMNRRNREGGIEPNKVVLKLVDPNSQPVVGAWAGTYVDWSDIAESPPIWFLKDGSNYKASEIDRAAKVISNKEGKITLTEEELFKPYWPTEKTVPLTAIDAGHYLAGLRELSRNDLGTEVTMTLQPGCRVRGRVTAATARKHKWSTKVLTVLVFWHVHWPCQYTSKEGRFEFVLPPGKYEVRVYAEHPDKAITLPIRIKAGQRDLDLTKYLDGTSLPPAAETEPSVQFLLEKMQEHSTQDKDFQYFANTDALPAGWSLKYIEDSDVGGNRAVLKAVPKPIDENDQSWKQERLEFRINSPEGKLADAIFFGKRPPRHQVDIEPDKYIMEYERRWGESGNLFRIWREFPVDLSRPGIYELQFIPRLGTAEIAGALDGCYWINFEKVDQGPEICGGAYQKAGRKYRLDGLPPGTYKLCAVTQRQSDNVFISPAEVTVSADEKATVNFTSPPRGNCSLKGHILGEQREYQAPWQRSPESPGRWFVLIRRFGSGPIVKTKAYEAVTIDSLYVVRGCNIVQKTKDQATYHIEGMVPGRYTVTAIEHPWWGCTITRQQSKTLMLKDGEEAVLDFDLRDIPKDDTPIAIETERPIEKPRQGIESDKVALKLVDANSRPVVGARVRNYVDWSDIGWNPPIWLNHIPINAESDAHGKVTLEAEELFWSEWPAERKVPLTAVDTEQDLAGLQMLTREDLGKEVTLKLLPRCRVQGRVSAVTARKRRWSTNVLNIEVDWGGHLPCHYRYSGEGRFEFVLPPGRYEVRVYAEHPDKAITLPIRIKAGQRELDLTKYLDGTSKLPDVEAENPPTLEEGSIEGRIFDIHTGKGISGVQLVAVLRASPTSEKRRVCTSGKGGAFSIGDLSSGEYLLQGDFPSVDVDVVSGKCTSDVLIGIRRGETVPAPKETTLEQQSDGQILLGTRLIKMPVDAMKEAFGPNENFSCGLLVRHGHEIVGRLLTLTREQKEAKQLIAPQMSLKNNSNGTIAMIKEEPFIHDYEPIEGEPGKLAPQLQHLEVGWKFKIHAKILEGGEKIHIELAAKQQEPGFETRQYRPGYDYQIPSPPEIFATTMTANNGEPVAIGRLRRGETAFCLIVTPSVIMPEPQPESLLGKKLPEPAYMEVLKQIGKRRVLFCFWDMNQRPSRNMITELAKRSKELQAQGIFPVLVHTSLVEPAKLKEWLDNRKILFSYLSRMEATSAQELFRWGVRAQPWLILTDEEGIVQAEGLSLEQLDAKLQESSTDEQFEDHDEKAPATKEYEVVQLSYVNAEEAAERTQEALRQMPEIELGKNVLLQPLERAKQIIIFGRKDMREIVKKLLAPLDAPGSLLEIRVFQLKYTDPDLIKKRIEGSYEDLANESQETVRVIYLPTMKQVTVIASPENMSKIAKQIAEWDVFQVFKPRIINLQNSDPAQMARLLTTLFAEEDGEGVNIRDVILGEDVKEKYNIVGPLSRHFTFEAVPGTHKIIIISNIPKAYDAVIQWILELDKQKMATKDAKEVREWMAGLAQFDRQIKESAGRLTCIGRTLLTYANDHNGKYPDMVELPELRKYLKTEEFAWPKQYEYLAGGRTTADRLDIVIYHDVDLMKYGKGTNVLFNDGHVEFASPERLNDLNINKTSILIETRILTAGDAFMEHIGLDPNSPADSEGWSNYLVHTSGDSTSFIIDSLHADLLIKTVAAHKDAVMLAAPQFCAMDGRPVTFQICDSSQYTLMPPDNEPNHPSGKPESKAESIELGTFIRFEPDALPDGKTVNLDFEWEYRRLLGVKKHTGPDKQIQKIPQIAVDSIKTFCPVPDGQTLLIAGKKITEHKKKPGKFQLADLPIIGIFFHSPSKTEETRNLLILIKPVINPQKGVQAQQETEPPEPFDPDNPLIKKLEEKLGD